MKRINPIAWLWLAYIISVIIVYLIIRIWGDALQDWMYLRHQEFTDQALLFCGIAISLRIVFSKVHNRFYEKN